MNASFVFDEYSQIIKIDGKPVLEAINYYNLSEAGYISILNPSKDVLGNKKVDNIKVYNWSFKSF